VKCRSAATDSVRSGTWEMGTAITQATFDRNILTRIGLGAQPLVEDL